MVASASDREGSYVFRATRLERRILESEIYAVGVIELWNLGGGGYNRESWDYYRRLIRPYGADGFERAVRLIGVYRRAHARLAASAAKRGFFPKTQGATA